MPSRSCLLGLMVVAALATAGFAGGAGGPQGLIVFSTFLPEYPLPDNFQVDRMYVVGPSRSTTELRASDVLSSDGSRVATVRAGSELWVANVDGSDARKIVGARDPISDVAWSENGSRLAFVAGGLWVVNADGTDAREIFAPPGDASLRGSGAWAPDGSHLVVFVGVDVWLVAADGSTQRLIFQPATSPPWAIEGVETVAWAPKSGALALTVGTSAGCGPGIYKDCFDWYALTFDRSGNRLARIDSALNLAWSPDGRRLALESGLFSLEPDQVGVEVVSADGSHSRRVTAHVRKAGRGNCWQYPQWVDAKTVIVEETLACQSHDEAYPEVGFDVIRDGRLVWRSPGRDETVAPGSTRVAFLARVRGHSALFTADLGAPRPRAREIATLAGQPSWSPDGRLAFTVLGARYRDLFVLRPSGRPQRLVRLRADRTLVPSWYGAALVYSSQLPLRTSPVLWTVGADGTGLHRLPGTNYATDPSWSPDGTRIAFASPTAIGTIGATGGKPKWIASGTSEWFMNPSWSPNGRQIVYTRTSYGIYLVGSNGGRSHRILKGSDYIGTASEAWTPDGTTIAYRNATDIDLMNADGTGVRTLVASCCGAPSWSPDGSKLAFYCYSCAGGDAAVAVANADGTDMHVLVANSTGDFGGYPDLEAPSWSPDGHELVFSGTSCTPDAQAADPRTVAPAICIVAGDGSGLRALTPPGIGAFAPSWRPSDH